MCVLGPVCEIPPSRCVLRHPLSLLWFVVEVDLGGTKALRWQTVGVDVQLGCERSKLSYREESKNNARKF